MPKIQEYLPEVDAAGPVGGTSPLLEQVGMFGRGMSAAGREIGDALGVVRQRETMAESADAFSSVAEQRATFMQRIQDETNAGTLDDKGLEKIKTDYQDWADKQADSYDTPGGRDAFLRASSRAGGSLLVHAAHGRAMVAGNQAKDSLNKLMNVNSNLVQNDPTQFDDLRDSQTEAIQAQVAAKGMTPADARIAQQKMDQELAKGAFRGFAQSDATAITDDVVANGGKIDLTDSKYAKAETWLNHPGLNDVFDSDTKKQLANELLHTKQTAQSAGMMKLLNKQYVAGAQSDAWQSQTFVKIFDGSYDPKESVAAVQKGLITPDVALKWNRVAEEQSKPVQQSNPEAFNKYASRILSAESDSDHITSPEQLAGFVKGGHLDPADRMMGYISPHDFKELNSYFKMNPANQKNQFAESALVARLKTSIGNDPEAPYRLKQALSDLQVEKQDRIKQGLPLSPMYDSSSKDYFLNRSQKYMISPQAALAARAATQAKVGDTEDSAIVPPFQVEAKPGVVPPPQTRAGGHQLKGQPNDAEGRLDGITQGIKDNFGFLGHLFSNENVPAAKAPAAGAATPSYDKMGLADLGKLDFSKLSTADKQKVKSRLLSIKAGK